MGAPDLPLPRCSPAGYTQGTHHSTLSAFLSCPDAEVLSRQHPMAHVCCDRPRILYMWTLMYQPTGMPIQRVIVVDHDAETSKLIAELLKDEGFAPLCYPAWLLSLACIEQAQANLLI